MTSRKVMVNTQKATLMSDFDLVDHTDLDKYVQLVVHEDWLINDWLTAVGDGLVRIKQQLVIMMIGSTDMLQKTPGKIANKLRQLILAVYNESGVPIKSVHVCAILPRANAEMEYQEIVRQNNIEIAKMVKDVRKFQHKTVTFLPVHKVVLEKFKFFDIQSGLMAVQCRIVKPVDRLFIPGTPKLNLVGKYQVKAYI